ncbi:MAG: hypothetical protein P4L84_37405 [Isosphaeraceae bacterium]|nr:hypothetical protein [Isosphaeraceae bacterium]
MWHPCRWRERLILLSSVVLCGCLPDDIVWLQDSGGFVFSSPRSSGSSDGAEIQSVFHYDVNKKTLHVVIPPGAMHRTTRPGVRLDGQRIAVAQLWTRGDDLFVHVHTVDLGGKVDVWSEPYRITNPIFGWGEDPRKKENRHGSFQVQEAAVAWTRDGRRLLVSHSGGQAQYDFKNHTFREYDTSDNPLLPIDPLLPDGSGFLAVFPWDAPPGEPGYVSMLRNLVAVRWEGEKRTLRLDPELAATLSKLEKENEQAFLKGTRRNPYFRRRGSWQDGIGIVPYRRGNVVIDPKDLTVTYRDDPAAARLWDWAERSRVDAMVPLGDGQVTIALRSAEVAVCKPQSGWKVLASGVQDADFFPSPNKELAAVRCRMSNGVFRIIVVDRNGETIGEFDTL